MIFKKLLYKYVFYDTDKGGLTSLPCPLYFPGLEKERWNNSKIQFKVNTEGSWKNTEVWRHLTFFSSPEHLCALCYDISIVGSSEMPLDGKLYQITEMHPKLPTGFPHHLPLNILKEEFFGNSNRSWYCPVSPSWGKEGTLLSHFLRDALQDHKLHSMCVSVLPNHTETSDSLEFSICIFPQTQRASCPCDCLLASLQD